MTMTDRCPEDADGMSMMDWRPGDEMLDRMRVSDHVSVRAQGVIVSFLRRVAAENSVEGGCPSAELDLARRLISDMQAAGLATFIKADLEDFVSSVRGGRGGE